MPNAEPFTKPMDLLKPSKPFLLHNHLMQLLHFTILLHLDTCHTFLVPKRYDLVKCKYQLKSSPAKIPCSSKDMEDSCT
ncbi:hypothetical protein ISN45_At05g035310 [Arabidopsis thaliana x Arabidopsis arenosa]|uniref:Uncharacterized protein n=3 Tax=Arabidopsis TaxID=3701 RepID=Q3E8J7_ARATH|nr:uncharacterized protein AT5G40855 [Arabidopsis thaliana]AED94608.1 hypothetical protein AT5G40855 [Arabidopsis thaliana]KAG7604459.1 hypothetical protein ISN45_At05g035310 [Arabidopsis thaliana x Arabidopsis arenosa]KAG7611386.1 hypothetical protein ISN44_As05g034870 [Arabidopsis suecica]|eukprot:NP_680370.1 hypothetical protein AT5G40855 [Arabidopsis thaliana]